MGEETLPRALLYGIAPAMAADYRKTFWGSDSDQRWSKKTKKLFGEMKKPVDDKLKDIFEKIGGEATARELVQCYTGAENKEQLPLPKRCDEEASEHIDTYCDGSVKNPRGDFWKIGGLGLWWPTKDGKQKTFNEAEGKFIHVERKAEGTMGWNMMNCLRGNSTRTETGAAMIATLSDNAAHFGSDNMGVIRRTNTILDHMRQREDTTLVEEDGTLRLGGEISHLHRENPWTRPFNYMANGDLWQHFMKMIKAKGHRVVRTTKVKGHATEAMIEEGLVRKEDKQGNGEADKAAGKWGQGRTIEPS